MHNDFSPDKLPLGLEQELGEIVDAEQRAPGVYYIAARRDEEWSRLALELFLVERDTPVISETAKSYGTPLPSLPDLLMYSMDDDHSGYRIVGYETAKYRVTHGLPLAENSTLHDIAVYEAELHPEYFGAYPVPTHTPWGYTLRHQDISNGIYWLETDQCRWVLAVWYPFWNSELSDYAKRLGQHTEYDLKMGVDNTYGCMFFAEQDACIPIFEMLTCHPELTESGTVSLPQLKNAIWEYHPEYAMTYNTQEHAGLNDFLGLLMNGLGADWELKGSEQNMIAITQEAGVSFLHFPVHPIQR